MDVDIRIRAVGLSERDLLIGMYEQFDPLGVALGLPPYTEEGRRSWIGEALAQKINGAAFAAGHLVGHCFLAANQPDSAELAIFVHQDFRRKGVGSGLVKSALKWAGAAGFQRIWSLTSCKNMAALRLQLRCGFRVAKSDFHTAEMEIDLR